MIIDCDIHVYPNSRCPLAPFIPAAFREAVAMRQDSSPGHGYANPFGVDRRDVVSETPADVVRLHLDPLGITYGVLQPQPGMSVSLIHSIDVANALARAANDWLIETYLRHDPRFLGSICVNMADPAGAAAEIRRLGAHPQMVQVLTCGEGLHLFGHRAYDPVYEACCEMGLVFAVHPGFEGSLRSSTPVGRPSSYFEWHNSLPLTYQAHVGSLVAEGTFEKFPGLKTIFVEGGVSWLAPLLWRMDKNFKALRSTVPWLREAPSEYVLRHCRLSTQPVEEPENPAHLVQLYEMVKAEKTLCFSTDFPHWDFDDPQRAFPSALPPLMKQRILYDNAAELYGLPVRVNAEGVS
ncbi:amidohydrolase family protein [Rariglobus hedericola]|uniref:Amidohydrolase n=1 Tax=Rariglobus hedericola TaxID=2597822 RepID=A0A556QKB8_9BACT|nr:amidohydrolase family protein [Rariglobus hedericola]TSJ77052.1 amidohydrolase [Rariglobus hedericola]